PPRQVPRHRARTGISRLSPPGSASGPVQNPVFTAISSPGHTFTLHSSERAVTRLAVSGRGSCGSTPLGLTIRDDGSGDCLPSGEFSLNRRPPVRALARALIATAALTAAVALSGCNTDGTLPLNERASRPLSEKMVADIASK